MRVGVLLNPVAGFGGALALHGTDELAASRFDEAVMHGRARRRLLRALARLDPVHPSVELLAAPGLLGATALEAAGLAFRTVASSDPAPSRTTRADTLAAVRALMADGIDVLVFAGGDGTATDVAEALGTDIPVVGVPSGVKMHSEVFARSPEGAGRLLAQAVADRSATALADVLDADGDGSGVVAVLRVPRVREPLQGPKAASRAPDAMAAARAVARELITREQGSLPPTTWVLGPGTTTAAVADTLGFTATLRGVDVRHDDGRIEPDVDEERLYEIALSAPRVLMVLGVVGGQGFLLGRGNQQISPRVLRAIGPDQVEIVAGEAKIAALMPPVLLVDADDTPGARAQDHPLLGYRRVRTGPRRSTVMNVVDAAA